MAPKPNFGHTLFKRAEHDTARSCGAYNKFKKMTCMDVLWDFNAIPFLLKSHSVWAKRSSLASYHAVLAAPFERKCNYYVSY